jgi:hypothetical protein
MPEPQLSHGVHYLPPYSYFLYGVAWEIDKNLMAPCCGYMVFDPIW